MPLHLTPMNRRAFLSRTAATLAGISVMRVGMAAPMADSCSLALLSDTHIAADPDLIARQMNMTANLKQVVGEVGRLSTRPQAVIVNGDCAFQHGVPADYAQFVKCLQPLIDADHSIHMTMGNHDERGAFFEVLKDQQAAQPPVESKHISILETPFANLFLLDTMKQVNVVTGELGEAQRAWLAQALDSRTEKPAVVVAHHTLQTDPPPEGKPAGGILDTAEFLKILHARPHVRGYVFGHSHRWSCKEEDGLHLVNLPAIAYSFAPTALLGWTLARLNREGMEFQICALDQSHPQHQETYRFNWKR